MLPTQKENWLGQPRLKIQGPTRRQNKVIGFHSKMCHTTLVFQQYKESWCSPVEKYTAPAIKQFYVFVHNWDIVSLTWSPDEKVIPVESPHSLCSFFTTKIILSDERVAWIIIKTMQELANSGEMTNHMDRSAKIQVVKITSMVQRAMTIHVGDAHGCIRDENVSKDHNGYIENGGAFHVCSKNQGTHHRLDSETTVQSVSKSLHCKSISVHNCSPVLFWPMAHWNNKPQMSDPKSHDSRDPMNKEMSVPCTMVYVIYWTRNVHPVNHSSHDPLNHALASSSSWIT